MKSKTTAYRLQISAATVTFCFIKISGAIYVGEPHSLGFSKLLTSTLNPKSEDQKKKGRRNKSSFRNLQDNGQYQVSWSRHQNHTTYPL